MLPFLWDVTPAFYFLFHHAQARFPDAVNEAVEQIAMADVLILNKSDLVQQEGLQQLVPRIEAINALAPIRTAVRGKVELGDVMGLKGFELETVEDKVRARGEREPWRFWWGKRGGQLKGKKEEWCKAGARVSCGNERQAELGDVMGLKRFKPKTVEDKVCMSRGSFFGGRGECAG